ncbi:MAG: hypothetical protein D6835_05720 [Candidatus Thermofonsia bacterium]|nr:MAG: hypothetical protein D6835_05720 [Candidatus Thermofonsia bacterium]
MITVIVHVANEDPIVCEIEKMPDPQDQLLVLNNPRLRDGKDVHYVDEDVTTLVFPVHRINFIQILPSADVEEVIGFVRE